MTSTLPRCRYCEKRHGPRYLCDPAIAILRAMHEKADSYNMPSIDFNEPIFGEAGAVIGLGSHPGDSLVAQLVVKALLVDVAGVWRPALVLTGRSADDAVLPQWVIPGDDDDIRRMCALVVDRGEAAITAAATARSQ